MSTAKKLNCWEAKSCGLEPGGENVARLGICPAAVEVGTDGANGGANGGRICWAVPGTLCGEFQEGLSCKNCDFLPRVLREEGARAKPAPLITKAERRRVRGMSLAAALVWILFALLGPVILPALSLAPAALSVRIISIFVAAASIGLAAYLHMGRGSRQRVVSLGFALAALQALAISWVENVWLNPGLFSIQVSWTCVLILSLPMVLPSTRRENIVGPLLVAAMSPLAYALGVFFGAEAVKELPILMSRTLPQFFCVAVAYLPAQMLGRLVAGTQRLGNYEMIERIGAGGMGEVWRAVHRMLARPAAIKLIRPDRLDAADKRGAYEIFSRFEKEARATALLGSPHTVEVYDFGINDEGNFYYVMELLRGIDLKRLVERFGPLPAPRTLHFLRQACHSLGEAHESGLIHRDVKPANLFTCRRGPDYDFIKVLDFGLIEEMGRRKDRGSSDASGGVGSGTPSYMAPEMWEEDWRADPRVDIYGLACVGYWLLTGKAPFSSSSFFTAVHRHARRTPPAPSSLSTHEIPGELDAIILRCLAADPDERPHSIRNLDASLAQCERSLGAWTPVQAQEWWRANLPDVKTPAAEALRRVSV